MEAASIKQNPTLAAKSCAATLRTASLDSAGRSQPVHKQHSARASLLPDVRASSLSPAQLSDLFGPPAPGDNILQLGGAAADISDSMSKWWSAIREENADLFNAQEAQPGRSSGSESTAPFLRRSPADS
eukprot:3110410-Pleurochrysis_carterae.AAC.3